MFTSLLYVKWQNLDIPVEISQLEVAGDFETAMGHSLRASAHLRNYEGAPCSMT